MMMKEISVGLPDNVLEAIRQQAEKDCRTVTAQVRYYLTQAAQGNGKAHREVWPPLLPVVNPSNYAAAKAAIFELQAEYDKLRQIEARTPTGLLPDQDERLRFCRDRIDQLNRQIRPLEAAGIRS